MELSSRNYQNSDYANQRKLFALCFPETLNTNIISNEFYNWKFKSFPVEPKSYQYVMEDSEIVGYYAAIPFQYKIENQILKCGMVCDVMTHPDRRGKGIFTKLGHYSTDQLKSEGLHFTTGYPIRPEVIPGHLKVGWNIILKMPMYLRLLGIKSFLPNKIKFLSLAIDPLIQFFQSFFDSENTRYETKLITVQELVNQTDYQHFLDLWIAEQKIALIKDKDFLLWRTSAPGTLYSVAALYSDKKLVGCSILRSTNLKGISSLAIMDFMVLEAYFSGCKNLHNLIRKIALINKNDVVVSMCTQLWASKYKFKSTFYIKTPAVFSLIVKKLNSFKNDEMLKDEKNWHLFWIDSDDL